MWCKRILLRRLPAICAFGSLAGASFVLPVQAQTPTAASNFSPRLSVGAEGSVFNTDALSHPVEYGVGVYADFDFLPFLGIEGEGRTIQFDQLDNVRQDVLLGGVRGFKRLGPVRLYAKVLAGLGSADFPDGTLARHPLQQHDTLPVGVIGGGLDYALTHRLWIRGDYEYQIWHGYGRSIKGGVGYLNPYGASVGISWKIF